MLYFFFGKLLPGLIRTRGGRSVVHIDKAVPSPNESASRDSNTRSPPSGGCSPLTSLTNYSLVVRSFFFVKREVRLKVVN